MCSHTVYFKFITWIKRFSLCWFFLFFLIGSCLYIFGSLIYFRHPVCVMALLYLLNTDYIFDTLGAVSLTSFINQWDQLLTVPVYSTFMFVFIFCFTVRTNLSIYVLVFLSAHNLPTPLYLAAETLNPLLINPLNFVHPVLVNFFLLFNLLCLVTFLFSTCDLNFFYKYLLGFLKTPIILSLIMLSTLFLGGFWAFQVGTWGGWWIWDLSETLLIFFYLPLLCSAHLRLLNLEHVKLFFIFLYFYIFYVFITELSINSLSPSLHTFFSNPQSLISLNFMKLVIIGEGCLLYVSRLARLSSHSTKITLNVAYLSISFFINIVLFLILIFMPALRWLFFIFFISAYLVSWRPLQLIWTFGIFVHIFVFVLLFYFLVLGVMDLNLVEPLLYTPPYPGFSSLALPNSHFFILILKDPSVSFYLKLFAPEFITTTSFSLSPAMLTLGALNSYQVSLNFTLESLV